ncbi:MAG TPA: hypothetical protein VKB26_09130 [Candidatus Acidoferrales bacterium]|nr:hypothetical protein [Candidatus Acidoferrales bacterium]
MKRLLMRTVMFLVAALAIAYAADWSVLQVRIRRQTAFSSVQVNQFLVAQLKGHRQEYFHMGTAQQPCVRAIFPHETDPPCWWLRRHPMQWNVVGVMMPEARRETAETNGCEATNYPKCDGMKYSGARADGSKTVYRR